MYACVCVCNPSDSQFTDIYPVYLAIQYILTHSLRCYRVFPAAPWAKTLILRRDQACTLSYQCLQWRAYSRGTTQLLMHSPPSHPPPPTPPPRAYRGSHAGQANSNIHRRLLIHTTPVRMCERVREEEEEKEVKERKAQIFVNSVSTAAVRLFSDSHRQERRKCTAMWTVTVEFLWR